jgi:hypothetical protein
MAPLAARRQHLMGRMLLRLLRSSDKKIGRNCSAGVPPAALRTGSPAVQPASRPPINGSENGTFAYHVVLFRDARTQFRANSPFLRFDPGV